MKKFALMTLLVMLMGFSTATLANGAIPLRIPENYVNAEQQVKNYENDDYEDEYEGENVEIKDILKAKAEETLREVCDFAISSLFR